MKKLVVLGLVLMAGSSALAIEPSRVVEVLANDMDLIQESSAFCNYHRSSNYEFWSDGSGNKKFYKTYSYFIDRSEDGARSKVELTMRSFSVEAISTWTRLYGLERPYYVKETPNYRYEINIRETPGDKYQSNICFSVFGTGNYSTLRTPSPPPLFFALLNDGPVKFRVEPSTSAKILFSLKKGDLVFLRGACGANWCPVRYRSSNGHMMRRYLDLY